jgi:RND family efflux transporter MFP subunit
MTPHPRIGLVLFGMLLSVLGCGKGRPPAEEEHPEAPVRAVPAEKIVVGEWTELLGTTQPLPNRAARVSAVMEGHVEWVLNDGKGPALQEGQQVQAGQIVVKLDDHVLRANRDRLQATLKDLAEQEKQAGFAVELASIDVRRLEGLLRSASTSGATPLVSRVELEKARVLQRDAESKQKSVAARREASVADLKALDKQLDFFALKTPIAGRLGIVQAMRGQTLTPGTVVAEVMDLREIDVLCYAPPDAAARLTLDQAAAFLPEDGSSFAPAKPLTGRVAFIAVQAQVETGNSAIKARFPNPDLSLRANAVARVRVLTKPEQERLTIPEAALSEDGDVPVVVVVEDLKTEKKGDEEKKLGTARRLNAIIGIRDRSGHRVELLGLEDPETKEKVSPDGLLFITAGGIGLKNKDVVKLREEEAKDNK